jgi:hypothetical protein
LPPGQRQPKEQPGSPATLQPGDGGLEPPSTKSPQKASFSELDRSPGASSISTGYQRDRQFSALQVKTTPLRSVRRPGRPPARASSGRRDPRQGRGHRIFSCRVYAASPSLPGADHPIYDIWLTDCKVPDQTIVTAAPDPPKAVAPPPPVQKRPSLPKQAAPRPPPQPQFQQQQPPPPPPPAQRPGGLFGGLFGN